MCSEWCNIIVLKWYQFIVSCNPPQSPLLGQKCKILQPECLEKFLFPLRIVVNYCFYFSKIPIRIVLNGAIYFRAYRCKIFSLRWIYNIRKFLVLKNNDATPFWMLFIDLFDAWNGLQLFSKTVIFRCFQAQNFTLVGSVVDCTIQNNSY